MSACKRIFAISDFNLHKPSGIRLERRRWVKGLLRLGHDVQMFSYRDVMRSCSPIRKKSIAKLFAKNKADEIIIEMIKHHNPDIILILTMKDLDQKSIDGMKAVAPNAIWVGRDVDWFPEKNNERIEIAKNMDIIIATNAGVWLKFYKSINVPVCAFIPCPCDPDIQKPYDVYSSSPADIIFVGRHRYKDNIELVDKDRGIILSKLATMKNVKLFSAFGNDGIQGIQVFREIANSKIALSINAVNNIRLCHSDRLINCLSCGTFVLAKRVPDTDLLFKDGKHVRYFDTVDEFFDLADWYLKHDRERERIAQAGMERAHKEFNCQRIAQYMLDLVETGTYKAPWATVLNEMSDKSVD